MGKDIEVDINAPLPERKMAMPIRLPDAREAYASKEKKIDGQYDRVFIEYLTKKIQKIEPGVGSFYFPTIKTLVLYWNKIIIYKILLDKLNLEEIKMEQHIQNVSRTIRMIKQGLIPLQELQQRTKGFNQKKTAKRF